jgi:hypothetical protein
MRRASQKAEVQQDQREKYAHFCVILVVLIEINESVEYT